MSTSQARLIFTTPVHFLAFGFGAGLSPVAPGTAGTLVAVPLYLFLAQLGLAAYLACVVILVVAGLWICGRSAEALGVHDHSGIVWDEMVGFLVTMVGAPVGWLWIAVGFVLFRFFDVLKPWPIRTVDRRVRGGTGIVMDDVLAGLYSLMILQVLATVLDGRVT